MHVLILLVGLALYYSALFYFFKHFGRDYSFVTSFVTAVLGFAPFLWMVLMSNDFSLRASIIYALIASTALVSISILIFS